MPILASSNEGLVSSHLAKAALAVSAAGGGGLSRHLAAASRGIAARNGENLPAPLVDRSCPHCASIFVPGKTARFRIVPLSRRRLMRGKRSGGDPPTKNKLSITCLLCEERTVLAGSEPNKKKKKKAIESSKKKNTNVKAQEESGFIPLGGETIESKDPTSKRKSTGLLTLNESKRKRKSKAAKVPEPAVKSPLQRFLASAL